MTPLRSINLCRAFLVPGLVLVVCFGAIVSPVYAASLPAGFSESLVTGSLSNPTSFDFAPDGRIFVTQQGGALRVVKNGTLLAAPFLTVSTDSTGERGLLGMAFDPNFGTNQYLYVYYTVPASPPHNRVSRFTANGDVVLDGSELPILDLENLSTATNHNGGAIHFGPDGKLYVAVGENANPANAQTLNNRLGKILRINADGTIPADNPFYGSATGDNRAIWALGLRNPFTFGFQPGTGRIFLNDVGQGTWEEIDDGIAGSNYGWNTCEGFCNPPNASFRDPLLAYPHSGGTFRGCAIVGGAFYNPAVVQYPSDYLGDYFFADLCSGWIRRYDVSSNTSTEFATGISNPVDLHVGSDGALYYLARGTGQLWRIVASSSPTNTPTITRTNTPTYTRTNTPTLTRTHTPTITRTNTPTGTSTHTPTNTRTNTPTFTRTPTAAPSRTNTLTATRTHTPTIARTNTPTVTRTNTATLTRTYTPTRTRTATPTRTNTPTVTRTNTRTVTRTYTATATRTKTATVTRTRTPTRTYTPSPTRTNTPKVNTPTPTSTRTNTPKTNTPTRTNTPRFTFTPTLTRTRTFTLTAAPVLSPTRTPIGGTWTFCANEHSTCAVPGTRLVRYGANGKFKYRTVTNSVACDNSIFGDPIYGVVKRCDYGNPGMPTRTLTPVPTRPAAKKERGLSGTYFDRANLRAARMERIDPKIDLILDDVPDRSSVRWTGYILAPASDEYRFSVETDGGVRLVIDGIKIIDAWNSRTRAEPGGTIRLEGTKKHRIELEYRHRRGDAFVRLFWESQMVPRTIVPKRALSPK